MHRKIRKIIKFKGAFSSEQALKKLMYLIIEDIAKKWTMPMHNWGLTISQLYTLIKNKFFITFSGAFHIIFFSWINTYVLRTV
ncbi:transposase-like protein, partial [Sphingobacterium sp. HSC-15S19]